MKQIKAIPATQFPLSLHCAFHQDVIKLIDQATASALHIEGEMAEYRKLFEDELLISNRQSTYVSTKAIRTADALRDKMAGVIINVVISHKTSTIQAKAAAADGLSAILTPFKGVGRRQYAAETIDVRSMLAALTQEIPLEWIRTLHLEDELAQLEAHNNVVADLVGQKSEENTARARQTDIETPELRRRIDEKYAKCVQIVNAFAIAIPTEVIDTFIGALNGTIDTYRSMADHLSANTPTVETGEGEADIDGEDTPTPGGEDTGSEGDTGGDTGGSDTGDTGGNTGGDTGGSDTPTPPPAGDDDEIIG